MLTPQEKAERSLHEVQTAVMYLQADCEKIKTNSENRMMLLKSINDSMAALKLQLEHDYHQMHVEEKLRLEQEED